MISEYDVEYVDTYRVLKKYADLGGNDSVTKDSVHPTQLGHGIIAHELDKYFWMF